MKGCEYVSARTGWAKQTRGLTPDHSLLIQEVLNHLDAVPHLDLRLFRHGKYGPNQLAGFHIHERGDVFTRQLFKIAAKASQGRPPG